MALCTSYCEHGGRCELASGHARLHDSRFCQWDDEHALTRGQADEVLAGKPGGQDYLDYEAPMADLLEVLADGEEDG